MVQGRDQKKMAILGQSGCQVKEILTEPCDDDEEKAVRKRMSKGWKSLAKDDGYLRSCHLFLLFPDSTPLFDHSFASFCFSNVVL